MNKPARAVGTCEPRYENCDRIAKTGCEVALDSDYEHCGACGSSCDAALRGMAHTGSVRCSAGRCIVDQCLDGYVDCDGAASNGCEATRCE